MTVSTCYEGTTIDTYLSVYEGSCGDLSCVAGNDDQSEPFYNDLCPVTFVASTVAMNTVEGQEYFVLAMGVFGEEGDFEVGLSCVLEGCTDVTACNYDPEANSDDGSCTYPEEDYLDCDGNCVTMSTPTGCAMNSRWKAAPMKRRRTTTSWPPTKTALVSTATWCSTPSWFKR